MYMLPDSIKSSKKNFDYIHCIFNNEECILNFVAPGPVSDLNAIPISPESLQLSWRPPQNPNGVITAYEITYQLISKGMCDNTPDRVNTVTSQQPGYTITGLNPHSKYRIGVAARTTIAGK